MIQTDGMRNRTVDDDQDCWTMGTRTVPMESETWIADGRNGSTIIGKYFGRQPAITELTAVTSRLKVLPRSGIEPMIVC